MTLYKLGHVFDTPSRRGLRKSALAILGAKPSFPPAASLEQLECEILDQGQTSSCGGHGTSQALFTALAAMGKPLGWIPSPDTTYKLVRARERLMVALQGEALPPLTDSGIMPSDLLPVLATYGIRAMGARVDGRNSDVSVEHVNDELNLDELIASGQTLITGEHRVDENLPNFLDLLCASIAGTGENQNGVGAPFGIGAFVDRGVMRWSKGDAPLAGVDFNDRDGGGHWFCCTSYRTLDSGKRVFRFPNSWGAGYGDAGHFEVLEDFLLQQVASGLDLYPFTVRE